MYGYLLQDWITLQGAGNILSITQSEMDWMSFQQFQDITFWTETRAVDPGGGTGVAIQFETAPTKDPSSFVPMQPPVPLTVGQCVFTPVLLAGASTTYPALARWVRWSILPYGVWSSTWSATFRVSCAANTIVGGG